MISIIKYADLTKDQVCLQNELVAKEFGHIPIVTQTKWATPDWSVMSYHNNLMVSFFNIVVRKIVIDNKEVQAIGISNLITPPEHRGHNYAFDLLTSTQTQMLEKLGAEVGLLLCADHMIPFYVRLGWYYIDCPVYFEQNGQQKLWTANTMLLGKGGEQISPALIDLMGLPW